MLLILPSNLVLLVCQLPSSKSAVDVCKVAWGEPPVKVDNGWPFKYITQVGVELERMATLKLDDDIIELMFRLEEHLKVVEIKYVEI